MQIKEVIPGCLDIGMMNQKLRILKDNTFTESGYMIHTYLLRTKQEVFFLIGTPPVELVDEWIDEIRKIANKNIKWWFLFESDDARYIADKVGNWLPDLVLISGAKQICEIKERTKHHFGYIEIRANRTILLGQSQFTFFNVVIEKRSSRLYLLYKEKNVLFGNDIYGSMYLNEKNVTRELNEDEKGKFYEGIYNYFKSVNGSKRFLELEEVIQIMKENRVQVIAPVNGMIMNENMKSFIQLFQKAKREITEYQAKAKYKVGLIYQPRGYIRELSDAIKEGLSEFEEVAVCAYDINTCNRETILREIPNLNAYVFAFPIEQGEVDKSIWDIVTSMKEVTSNEKIVALCYTDHDLIGKPTDFKMRLQQIRCSLTIPDFVVQRKIDEQTLKNAYEYGYEIGCILQRITNTHRPKLVKCLVCGEIFEASLGICPVCGVGLDQCVPVDEQEVLFYKDTNHKYVIIGGGIAAVSAADAIRSRDGTGSIEIFSAEECLPINRPFLTKKIDKVFGEPEELRIHDISWYEEKNIKLYRAFSVIEIDTKEKFVRTEDNTIHFFDKLVYAAGAECFIPPFEGANKKGVLALRHLTDMKKLESMLVHSKNAVVIGGGVLGLEAASELMRAGMKVTVLEANKQILGNQIDKETAERLKEKMKSFRIACYENVKIGKMEGNNWVSGVSLLDGRIFPAEIVIVSCGNAANVQLAKEAGIKVERAILVDDHMCTSAKDIYACGDCAQFEGINYQLWQEAQNQGKIAGANAAGESMSYQNQTLGMHFEGFGSILYKIGHLDNMTYKTVIISDTVKNRMEKYWFFGGALQGALLFDVPDKIDEVQTAVLEHARYQQLFN